MGFYFPDGKGGKHFVESYSLQAASSTEKGGVKVTSNDGLIMGNNNELKLDFSPFIVNGKLQITVNGVTYTFNPDSMIG